MNNLTPRRHVIITGGSGFIGTYLSRALVKRNYRVTVIDLVSSPTPVSQVHYIEGDVRKLEHIERSLSEVDAIVHLAANVSVPWCEQYPYESYETNTIGTLNVIEAVKRHHQRTDHNNRIPVVFSSSSAVYGRLGENVATLSEDSLHLGEPISFYGEQKLASERILLNYSKLYRSPVIIFRFFNVYGDGQVSNSPYSGVISSFQTRIQNDLPIQLHGGGSQTRDFIHVGDIVSAIAISIEKALAFPDFFPSASPSHIFNLGTGYATSIHELGQVLCNIYGVTYNKEVLPPRLGDIHNSCSNVDRAKAILQWTPAISLTEGLHRLVHKEVL